MDKETFLGVIQATLLSFDGITEKVLIEKYGLNPAYARVGFELYIFLKDKEINNSLGKFLKKNPFHSSPEPSK